MAAINLKKKVGPLPVWAWTLAGTGTIGIFWYFHKKSSSTAATDALASQQAAAGLPGDTSGGSGSAGPGAPIDTTGLATGSTSTDVLDQELQVIQAEITALSAGPTDTTPGATLPAPSGFGTMPLIVRPGDPLWKKLTALEHSAHGSSPTAAGKRVAGLPILAQLEDLHAGLITKAQLGPNATKQLNAAGGNATKAIHARQNKLTIAANKHTQRPQIHAR